MQARPFVTPLQPFARTNMAKKMLQGLISQSDLPFFEVPIKIIREFKANGDI